MKNCTVCIDESGDLGVNRGTRWFVISAVIIPEESEKETDPEKKKQLEKENMQEKLQLAKKLKQVKEDMEIKVAAYEKKLKEES